MRYQILFEENGSISVPNFHFITSDGVYAFIAVPRHLGAYGKGEYVATCKIPGNFLNDECYFVGLALSNYSGAGVRVHFFEQNALSFNVRDPMTAESGYYGFRGRKLPGIVRPSFEWEFERLK